MNLFCFQGGEIIINKIFHKKICYQATNSLYLKKVAEIPDHASNEISQNPI